MYRYAPASETSYGYPFHPLPYHRAVPSTFTWRERSLAEAEYLAAQAAREEEEATLRRRLAEIQLARQQEEDLFLPPRRHALDSYQRSSRYATPHRHTRDNSDVYRQIEQEIRAREALLHEPQVSPRPSVPEPEAVFPQVYIRRAYPQPHPRRRCTPALGPSNPQSLSQRHPSLGRGPTRCQEGSSQPRQVYDLTNDPAQVQPASSPTGDASLDPFKDFFISLLSTGAENMPTATSTGSTSPPETTRQKAEAPKVLSETKAGEASNDADALLKEFYNALSGGLNRPAPATSAPSNSTGSRAGPSCQRSTNKSGQEAKPPSQPNPMVINLNSPSDWGHLLSHILGGQRPTKHEPATSESSSSKTQTSQGKSKCPASAKTDSSQPAKAKTTLKEELEARLNNEYESEVRDTIQALLASVADSSSPPESSKPAPPSGTSTKGKSKAEEEDHKSSGSLQGVSQALKLVTNIESSFRTLQSDFTFPSGLDFADDTPSSPVSTASESRSVISILAFTSRNQPVRFYEQALGALLAKLDAIESQGSDELRSRRKEVVNGVEKALEELETEVEGRYKAHLARDEREKHDSQATTSPVISPLKISTDSASISQSQDVLSVEGVEVEDAEHGPANDDLQLGEVVLNESVVNLSSPIPHVDVADEPVVQEESTAVPATEPDSQIPPDDDKIDVPSMPSPYTVEEDISAVIAQPAVQDLVASTTATESSEDLIATIRPGLAESHSKSFDDDSESTKGFLLEENMDRITEEKGRRAYKENDTDLGSDWSDIEGH